MKKQKNNSNLWTRFKIPQKNSVEIIIIIINGFITESSEKNEELLADIQWVFRKNYSMPRGLLKWTADVAHNNGMKTCFCLLNYFTLRHIKLGTPES